ncbi:MAG: hydroxymethylglutaryl-CoA lyase [Mycobacterium sp.]|jgi:hydroxymethylglutaryl-CoA lyase|nr:hydroxymethylglutaryl-CoA lyase [Mycobacterium sp.]
MTVAEPRPYTPQAELRDVTLRDGLQLTAKTMPTELKVNLIRELLALGMPTLEIGSMARPDLVPPLADTIEVITALAPEELDRCWVWVATPRHVEKAAAAGARRFQYCLSASDSHNEANIGRDTETSVAAMPDAIRIAHEVGGSIQLCIATAFTCPFEGIIDPRRVLAIAADPRTDGAEHIVVCDTIGQAIPTQVADLVGALRAAQPQQRIVFHGHDTWGLGVANTLAAIDAGATMVDGSLGGLGGCPFAPGASGNTATEDLLFALRPDWITPKTLGAVVEISENVLAEIGEPNRSKTAQGARSAATAFPWVIGDRDEAAGQRRGR